MPRPPQQPEREQIPEGERAAYDWVVERRAGKPDWYYRTLLVSPPVSEGFARLGRYFRTRGDHDGSFSHSEREWVDQVLCADWGTNVVLGGHIPDALARGVRVEAIESLRAGREDELDDHERLLTRYVREVESGSVTDESWNELERRLGERGVVEYTAFIVFLIATIRFQQALGRPEPTDEEIEEMIRDFASGAREVPSPRDIA